MGLKALESWLGRQRRIALDTNIFIYQWTPNPKYVQFTDFLFLWINSGTSRAITSTITMTELLVHPLRNADEKQADQLFALLSTWPRMEWIAPDLQIAALAAELRAQHGLRTPDALHAATAVRAGATGIVTNDPVFRRVTRIETLVLDELL